MKRSARREAMPAVRVVLALLCSLLATGWTAEVRKGAPAKPGTQDLKPALPNGPVARNVTITGDARRATIDIELSEKVDYTVFVLGDPYRLIVDVAGLQFALSQSRPAKGKDLVREYRFGLLGPGKSRMVFDISGPLITRSSQIETAAGGGVTLRIVIEATDAKTFASVRAAQPPPVPQASPRKLEETGRQPRKPDQRRVIVLDPGHGGVDAGAVGAQGRPEKAVVLEFAKLLRTQLKASGKFDVLLTREIDVFLPLDGRVEFARENNADLFVSLHTDSVPPALAHLTVRGATVYTNSQQAGDRAAKALAEKENRADVDAGYAEQLDEQPDVAGILADLVRRETENRSIYFAKVLIRNLKQSTQLSREPHRKAAFRVLRAPDFPSVLIELGFLSNVDDEKQLVSDRWQKKIAGALAVAIGEYFSSKQARRAY